MNTILVEIEKLDNEIILSKKYLSNTSIHTIKNDLLDLLPLIEISLIYNEKELDEYILLNQITNDLKIKLGIIKNYDSIYENHRYGDYLIRHYKSKIIISSINNLTESYIFEFKILKIVKISYNNILFLTINHELYSLKIKEINKKKIFKIKKKKENIKNIFYYDRIDKSDTLFMLSNYSIIECKIQNTKYIINISDININNIKNIDSEMNIVYIETYDNILFLYYINDNTIDFYKKYENVKKIVTTYRDIMILTNNGKLYHIPTFWNYGRYKVIYDDKIFENNFIDIQTRNSKSFFVGLLENYTILLFGKDIKNEYKITDELSKYLINIKEVNLNDGFMYALTKDNKVIIWGPSINRYNKSYIIIENINNIYSSKTILVLITNINIIIIDSTIIIPKYIIKVFTHPLLYENIIKCYIIDSNLIYLINNNNQVIKFDYFIDYIDSDNYYEENNIGYIITIIIDNPIKKFILFNWNYLYIDMDNNSIININGDIWTSKTYPYSICIY